jgi:hypothetical protein
MSQVFQRNEAMEAAPLDEEVIIFDPTTSRFFLLNRTSTFLWDRLASPTTAETLASEIDRSFAGADPQRSRREVQATLEEWLSLNLVTAAEAASSS